ncbi:MAG: NlpC/P60 family protein [Asticcacaulis sp.]
MTSLVDEARQWIGTPYVHGQSLKGVGCDCLGLVRGVWRAVCGDETWTVPAYSGDWAESSGKERLKEAFDVHLIRRDLKAARPGDVLIFRMRDNAVAKHAAILSAGHVDEARACLIHAYWGHAVTEGWLGPWWRRRVIGAYAFPDVVC